MSRTLTVLAWTLARPATPTGQHGRVGPVFFVVGGLILLLVIVVVAYNVRRRRR